MFPKQMKLLLPRIILISILLSGLESEADESYITPVIARPGCKDSCGNVSIPFPFGIGANCFLDSWFEVECKVSPHSNHSTKPFLSRFNIEVVGFGLGSGEHSQYMHDVTVRLPPFNVCTEDTRRHQLSSFDLRGSPFNFSINTNSFLMEGCAGSMALFNQSEEFVAGCATVCGNNDSVTPPVNKCYGVECCQSRLFAGNWYDSPPSLLQFYRIDIHGQPSGGRQNCLASAMIATDSVDEYMGNLLTSSDPATVPVVLYWSWTTSLRPDQTSPNTICVYDTSSSLQFCDCVDNSFGINPYVTNGCQVPKACKHCYGSCKQIIEEDHKTYKYYCLRPGLWTLLTTATAIIVYVALGIAIFPLLMVFGCRWVYYFTKGRKKTNRRVRFFKLMLQRHHSSNDGVVESTKLYTHKELDKATDHFSENRVLGKGGQGTVYKGMLVDGRIVAVKKSKLTDESQMEQFINEIVILSQVNHRNVVKVLGCCLETEVPLLVYEFISNGTLHQHIHERHTEANFGLSWTMRLKILTDSAGAIAYLHSSSSTPVYHRDIKSSNILLDDKYRAKVSDFGSSKTISMDQTHLTTLVQGTIGYLDPEYFESNIFTEKSDVYSFGVVMLELLTGKKPIYRDGTMEQKSLVREFFRIQNFCLSDMLDPEVVKEAKEEEIMAFVDLAKQCLNESGRFRPTMKEVAMTLEMIIKPPSETSSQNQQAFRNERFTETVMLETSDVEFQSSPIVGGGAASPLYIDVDPLLQDTI